MLLRRLFTRWLPVAALAIVATFVSSPATAQADVAGDAAIVRACPAIYPAPAYCFGDRTQLASTSHVGWVYLNLNYCPQGALCARMFRISTSAWSWSGSQWNQTSLKGGWVYVYPYTGEWRWAWTQESGWVAISGGRFEIRRY